MSIILLVRHAENDAIIEKILAGRAKGFHLNEKGREQVELLASTLEKINIKAVYSSPLERALETATPIAAMHKLNVIERVGLNEINFGDWQGEKWKVLSRKKLWKVVQNSPSRMRFPGGESFAEAQFRLCQEIETIAGEHSVGDVIVCVSHADPIKLLIAHYCGMPLDSFQHLSIGLASVSGVSLDEIKSRILFVNYDPGFHYQID